jgi:hypothetical protein
MRWPFGMKRKQWKGFRALAMEKATIDGPPSPPPGHDECAFCGELSHTPDLYVIGPSQDVYACNRCIPILIKQLKHPETRGDRENRLREMAGQIGERI